MSLCKWFTNAGQFQERHSAEMDNISSDDLNSEE